MREPTVLHEAEGLLLATYRRKIPGASARVPALFLDRYAELGISTTEAMLVVHLLRFAQITGAHPSRRTLARLAGIHLRNVRRHLRSLQLKGFLEVRTRTVRGLGTVSNEFDLTRLMTALSDADRRAS
jgi:DNA-binding MarR family transcriptional regulator